MSVILLNRVEASDAFCRMRGCMIAIEGVSIERRKALKMAKKWQKTHKNIKKLRARLHM